MQILAVEGEIQMAELPMPNPGRITCRDSIFESPSGFGCAISENALEVFMRQLRLKVETREPKLIQSIRGFGYMMQES